MFGGILLIASGAALMLLGVITLGGWVGGKSSWFDASVFDRPGTTKNDRLALYVTFMAMVLAPLLSGALMIAYGLYSLP